MSHKPTTADRPIHALSGFSLLAAEGPGAEAFLQAQSMNDVRALALRQWQWNGWLNAKGRVIALFALLRAAPEAYWLVLPDFPAAELLPRLQRYVLRSKLVLRVLEDWRAGAEFAADAGQADGLQAAAPANIAVGGADSGYTLDFSGQAGKRRLWLMPAGCPGLCGPDAGLDLRWHGLDLQHGLPRLEASQSEAWTPQMLSLERLDAYSLKKGCYPGQEIVARTHYLGQAKRGLAGVVGEQLRAGMDLFQGESPSESRIGTVACASQDGRRGLAVVPAGLDARAVLRGPAGRVELDALASGLAR